MYRYITVLSMVLAASAIQLRSADAGEGLYGLSAYERTVLIIKYYETLHIDKGEYIGYGHRILPGEDYVRNQRLTPSEADRLLRRDLDKLYRIFSAYGRQAWLLTALAYNVGAYAILGTPSSPRSALLRLIEANAPDESVRSEYLKYCHYKGRPLKGLMTRRCVEFNLLYETLQQP